MNRPLRVAVLSAALVVPGAASAVAALPSAQLTAPMTNWAAPAAAVQPGPIGTVPDLGFAVNGQLKAVASVGDRTYVGGSFSRVGPMSGPAATLDRVSGERRSASPRFDGAITVAAPDGTGGLIVGGRFSHVDGHVRDGLARLDPLGGLDEGWQPQVSFDPTALAVSGGRVLAAGRVRAARRGDEILALDLSTGAEVGDWRPQVGGSDERVSAMAPAAGGGIVLAGSFSDIDLEPRENLALIDPTSLRVQPDWGPQPDGPVSRAAAAAGRIYLAGRFSALAPGGADGLAAIDATTGEVDTAWLPDAYQQLDSLAADGDHVFVSGRRSGEIFPEIAALSPATGSADWRRDAFGSFRALAAGGGELFVGGGSGAIDGVQAGPLAALSGTTGALRAGFDPQPLGAVEQLALAGTNLLIGGSFTAATSVPAPNVAAIDDSTGLIESGWAARTDGEVSAITSAGGRIVLGGSFNQVNGTARGALAAVDPVTGQLATSFDPAVDGAVKALATGSDRLYLAGEFQQVDGASRPRVAALEASSGALVQEWAPAPNGQVSALGTAPGRVFLGGSFTEVGGGQRANLASLSAVDGSLEQSFAPGLDGGVNSLALDGTQVYLLGRFTHIGDAVRRGIGAVDASSGTVTPIDPLVPSVPSAGSGAPDYFPPDSLALSDGKAYLAGQLDALRVHSDTGSHDADWLPSGTWVGSLVAAGAGRVFLLGAPDDDAPGGAGRAGTFMGGLWRFSPTAKPAELGPPRIVQEPGRLRCEPGTWTNAPTSRAYAWLRGAEVVSNQATYAPASTDDGRNIRCRETARNLEGSETAESLPVITGPDRAGTAEPPELGGEMVAGQEVHCASRYASREAVEVEYGWISGSEPITDEVLRRPTAGAYRLTVDDVRAPVRCAVTVSSEVSGGSALSPARAGRVDRPAELVSPSIVGFAEAGEELGCLRGLWSQEPTDFSFQWLRDGAAITGATSPRYAISGADEGATLSCRVTATTAGGSSTEESAPLRVIP